MGSCASCAGPQGESTATREARARSAFHRNSDAHTTNPIFARLPTPGRARPPAQARAIKLGANFSTILPNAEEREERGGRERRMRAKGSFAQRRTYARGGGGEGGGRLPLPSLHVRQCPFPCPSPPPPLPPCVPPPRRFSTPSPPNLSVSGRVHFLEPVRGSTGDGGFAFSPCATHRARAF